MFYISGLKLWIQWFLKKKPRNYKFKSDGNHSHSPRLRGRLWRKKLRLPDLRDGWYSSGFFLFFFLFGLNADDIFSYASPGFLRLPIKLSQEAVQKQIFFFSNTLLKKKKLFEIKMGGELVDPFKLNGWKTCQTVKNHTRFWDTGIRLIRYQLETLHVWWSIRLIQTPVWLSISPHVWTRPSDNQTNYSLALNGYSLKGWIS